tara:strand:- start:3500 stop:3745 length:246 start_codon:yes stop_codon:yes gene_type:complete
MKVKTLIKLLQGFVNELGEDTGLVFYHLENHSLDGDFHLETVIPFDAQNDDEPPWVEMTLGKYEEVSADSGTCGCCNRIDE